MKIATYNLNSINARLESLQKWLEQNTPDIVAVQEIKTEVSKFPFFELEAMGYKALALGQKSYNGVAILSRHKMTLINNGLPNFEDVNFRYIEADIEMDGKLCRFASIYLPNGTAPYNKPEDNSKFEYKLAWMDAFYEHAKSLLALDMPVILAGDFNVIATDVDVYSPKNYANSALFRSEVKERLKALQNLGFYDAYRTLHPDDIGYTFWDYAARAFEKDNGMRIDYIMLSALAVDKLQACYVDKLPRTWEKPSDHTPLMAEIR